MKTKQLLTREEKLKYFGQGEWLDEVDEAEFEHMGLKCLVVRVIIQDGMRMFGGYFCGYVNVKKILDKNNAYEIDVHGGITFLEADEEETKLGFDCAHSCDIVPSMQLITNEKYNYVFFESPTYKDFDFAVEQTKKLAEEIIKLNSVVEKKPE